VSDTRPELFFGLIGAAGTDLSAVRMSLERALCVAGYKSRAIRISDVIAEVCGVDEASYPSMKHEEVRIRTLIDGGDRIRGAAKTGEAILFYVLPLLASYREEAGTPEGQPADATAYIFDSLKHPEEVRALRNVYGSAFFAISVYTTRQIRLENLKKRIAKSHLSLADGDFEEKAKEIIEIDEHRGGDYEQDVRNAFPEADFFISSSADIEGQVQRFVDLIFGSPFITPQKDEYWMFHARAVALRSADLSRQVGAVLTSCEGDHISSGCNEVPASGGGVFWDGDAEKYDDRDFRHGRDANAVIRNDIVKEIVSGLRRLNLLNIPESCSDDQITIDLVYGEYKEALEGTRIRSLIEFGRIVHAEMNAIIEAARRGVAVFGGTLYCTTFPCHMCARHIIGSGVRRVVYIEPYPKSMTKDLYRASTVVDGEGGDHPAAVSFEPFRGVAPQLYFRLFAAEKRKDEQGYSVIWLPREHSPKGVVPRYSYLVTENAYSSLTDRINLEELRAKIRANQE